MKSRWLLNLALLLVVGGIALFLYLNPKQEEKGPNEVKVSNIVTSSISNISIQSPAKKPVQLQKRDGHWFLVQPYAARAGVGPVMKILAILGATTVDKFDATDLARFGLDNPTLRLKLDNEEFTFGTFNPVSGQQYIAYRNSVYLVSTQYAEAATTQVTELLDKHLLAPGEHVAGFDFSRLEQWEEIGGLRVDHVNGEWKVSTPNAHPVRKEMDDWFADGWESLTASSVEPYKPVPKNPPYPSFEIVLKDGKRLHIDKQLESPELILARPDEGMLYHFPGDLGFTLLNPPVNVPKK